MTFHFDDLMPHPKMVCHIPVGQILMEVFLKKQSIFDIGAWLIWVPSQTLHVQSWAGPKIFSKICSFHQKVYNFLSMTDTQNRQMHTLQSIYEWANFTNDFSIQIEKLHNIKHSHTLIVGGGIYFI